MGERDDRVEKMWVRKYQFQQCLAVNWQKLQNIDIWKKITQL